MARKTGGARISTGGHSPRKTLAASHSQQQSQDSKNKSSTFLSQESVSTEAILSKLARATEIEKELDSIASEQKGGAAGRIPPSHRPHLPPTATLAPGTDEKNQALRLQLCGIFSDVILVDCTLAHTHDAVGRLWKCCFYSRIDELRTRIMLGKRSVAKRHQATANTNAAIATATGGAVDPSKKIVHDLEKQLSTFLDESIQLYKYIIERYVRELLPLSQSQTSTTDTDDNDEDDDDDDAKEEQQERFQAIIISLYRMNIHLGDLYRYSTSFKLAEECYLLSAKLSPGTGNPYNQLAVVAQQSPDSMTTLALYYYVRSLMATVEPFETSRVNLHRLFDANRRWITDHKRGDQEAGNINFVNHDGMTKKEQKEWMHKQRTAANRMALARLVDLQWVFYKGISSLDNSVDGRNSDVKTGLDGLIKEMSSLHESLTNLMEHASFSESLLCKLIAILAFSTLGASMGGKLLTAEQFDAKRTKDPQWHEGVLMSNQALAFSFFLRFCAMLANDVDAMIAKKAAAGSLHKLGTIRSLPSLLLGFRFVTSIYEGCDWFHGLSHFSNSYDADCVDEAERKSINSAIHKLCTESHEIFWSTIAVLANRMDTLPNLSGGKTGKADLDNIRDFDDFHGYALFASFLDKCDSNTISTMRKSRRIKYASVDEAKHALAKTKPFGGTNGGDAATMVKIEIFLSLTDRKTCTKSHIDEVDEGCFLSRIAGSSTRVFINNRNDRDEIAFDQSSPTFVDDEYTADMGVEDIYEVTTEQPSPNKQLPPKTSLSGIREGLLTPAALLAANTDQPQLNLAVSNEAKEPSPLDSLVQWITKTGIPPVQSAASSRDIDPLLNSSPPLRLHAPMQAPLHPPTGLTPPPGFSIQPQQEITQVPLAPFMGISSTVDSAPQQYEQLTGGIISQAGSRFSSSNTLFETLNPFAPHLSFNNDLFGNSFGLSQQPGCGTRIPTERGPDTKLDFLSSNSILQLADDSAASDAFEDKGDSILNFLFDSNDASKAGQQFYSSQQRTLQTQYHGMSQTNNPFAT